MADDREGKHGGEPVLDFRWDPLVLAFNHKYSTTIRIELTGWWGEDRPREVAISCYQEGEAPPDGNTVRIQKGRGIFPLTGLEPGHHYLVVCYIGDRLPVQKVITVPELPKSKEVPYPTDFVVEDVGDNGKYKLFISVFLKEKPESVGVGVPEVVVTILDKDSGQSWETKTGAGGTVIFDVPEFTEREKNVAVFVGVMKPKYLKLLGPKVPVRS